MYRTISFYLAASILAGCSGPDPVTPDETGDSGTEESLTSAAIFVTSNFMDGSTVADVTVASPLETVTTDASGEATVTVPAEEVFETTLTHPDFMPVRWFGKNEVESEEPFYAHEPQVPPALAEGLAGAFGTSLDSTKGHLIVSALQPIGNSLNMVPLKGVAYAPDSAYDAVAAEDSSAAGGFSAGSTSVDGANVFINMDTGPLTVTFTPPAGYSTCHMFPYNTGEGTNKLEVEVSAGTITRVSVNCWPDE